MKKIKFLIFVSVLMFSAVAFGQVVTAQVYENPTIVKQSSKEISILKVEISDFTYVTLKFCNNGGKVSKYTIYAQGSQDAYYILDNTTNKKYEYMGKEYTKQLSHGNCDQFILKFPKLPNSIKSFDFIEGKNQNSKNTYWNFYGVKLEKAQQAEQTNTVSLSSGFKPQFALYHKGSTAARVILSSSADCGQIYVTTASGKDVYIEDKPHYQVKAEQSGTGYWMDIYDFEEPVVKISYGRTSLNLNGKWGYEHRITYKCSKVTKSSSGIFSSYSINVDENRVDSEKPIKEIDDAYFTENCKNGSASGCADYLSRFESGAYRTQAEKLKKDKEMYENIGSLADCNKYLQSYPQGVHVSDVKAKINEFNALALKEKQIKANSNKALWKLGNKLCVKTNNGNIIVASLEAWNEDKSMAQVKVITSVGGTFNGESVTKGNTFWINAKEGYWHLCLDSEIQESLSNDNSTQKQTQTVKPEDKSCYTCGGRGACVKCNGKGYKPCNYHDTNRDGKCTTCNNRGILNCYDCNSSGSCYTCSGTGKRY